MPSLTLSDRQKIVELCRIHREATIRDPDFRQCIVFKQYFVKYNSPNPLKWEYETQRYIYSMAVDDPNAPRVPEIVDYFTEQWMAYLVMEFIGATTPADDAHKMVADALQWLRDVPAPPGARMGSVGGGPARHRVFKNYGAPLLFTSNEALQNYMNKALWWIPPNFRPPKMSFIDEKLIFTQSDLHKGNFFIDKNGKMCILDFADIVLLPESFASYTVNGSSDPFVKGVAEYLKWPSSPNQASMSRARAILWMMSDIRLGEYANLYIMCSYAK
ncbi:hypothetical protein FRB99_001110 [Tulasnella sp. 403]|nr:hypothetical protein FRB99_001110 [Tulasnella sp. 403]